MTAALTEIRTAPGLDSYLDALEVRLERAVEAYPGVVAAVGKESLAAGGKRLRPLIVFLSAPADADGPLAAGVAVELLHMATLVHDDLIDGAEVRRGRASVWSAHGVDVARATGDYLFARAFSELAAAGNLRAVQILADAALCLVRGETMQRRQRHDAETTVDAYIERCALKTAKLFEAACVLGGGESLREFGANLGIVFQIVDDILDCTGQTIETGKVAGTDLRDGTPTLPLILGAQRDAAVHRALAGGPQEGALVRVAECGALEESREIALDYAARARAALNGTHRKELDALVTAVLERRS
ncbi:MAG TPA: polyprenyl synthetase family protein [Gaiellaceae bacterium]